MCIRDSGVDTADGGGHGLGAAVNQGLGLGAGQGVGDDFRPVSYTHLDVYKRQPFYGAGKMLLFFYSHRAGKTDRICEKRGTIFQVCGNGRS